MLELDASLAIEARRHRCGLVSWLLFAAAVAWLVVAIGMGFGFNSGYAINPARPVFKRRGGTLQSVRQPVLGKPLTAECSRANAGTLVHEAFLRCSPRSALRPSPGERTTCGGGFPLWRRSSAV